MVDSTAMAGAEPFGFARDIAFPKTVSKIINHFLSVFIAITFDL
jgi:hypothetical protein